MLCPLCQERGGERIAVGSPFDRWLCHHCHKEYLAYEGYPVHPDALEALAQGQVRCPVCGARNTTRVEDAPLMESARAFHCSECNAIFPAMIGSVASQSTPNNAIPDQAAEQGTSFFVPIHPRAMIETVTGVERMPNFFALSERLREYLSQTGFTLVRSEDQMNLDTQVREFTFFSVPDEWVEEQAQQTQAVQGTLSFSWHAGHAQFAGAPVEMATSPVPIAISLGAVINPKQVAKSLRAYLRLIEGLSDILSSLQMAETTSIKAHLAVSPVTQEAGIEHLSCIRECSLDLRLPEQWAGLIAEMIQQKALLAEVRELVCTSGNGSQCL